MEIGTIELGIRAEPSSKRKIHSLSHATSRSCLRSSVHSQTLAHKRAFFFDSSSTCILFYLVYWSRNKAIQYEFSVHMCLSEPRDMLQGARFQRCVSMRLRLLQVERASCDGGSEITEIAIQSTGSPMRRSCFDATWRTKVFLS